MIYALNRKIFFLIPWKSFKVVTKRLAYDLRCLQVHVIPLDFRVLMLSIIVQLNLFGELKIL